MPKKFQGENSKATEARAREQEKKRTASEQKAKVTEDAKWTDDDKSAAKKQQRQAELEAKQAEKLEKKREAKLLLLEEESTLKSKAVKPAKVTRAHIEAVSASSSTVAKPKEPVLEPLQENVNRLVEDAEVARDVDEAIQVLSVDDTQADRHPERRAAAAYKAFEDVRLPQLKAENSNMRLSQLKQMLKKEWQKSPQNPFNQMVFENLMRIPSESE